MYCLGWNHHASKTHNVYTRIKLKKKQFAMKPQQKLFHKKGQKPSQNTLLVKQKMCIMYGTLKQCYCNTNRESVCTI